MKEDEIIGSSSDASGQSGSVNHYGLAIATPEEMRLLVGEWLFADGGVIAKNPSPIGGTWTWRHVRNGGMYAGASGIIYPRPSRFDAPFVSNNVSELYALVNGLASLPDGWTGTIASDSFCSLCRRVPGSRMVGVPDCLVRYARAHFARFYGRPGVRWLLLDGHPTKAQLTTGIGKRGNVVSVWNVICDEECTRQAEIAKAQRESDGAN